MIGEIKQDLEKLETIKDNQEFDKLLASIKKRVLDISFKRKHKVEGIDQEIKEYIDRIRSFPQVETYDSCGGHLSPEGKVSRDPHLVISFQDRDKLWEFIRKCDSLGYFTHLYSTKKNIVYLSPVETIYGGFWRRESPEELAYRRDKFFQDIISILEEL